MTRSALAVLLGLLAGPPLGWLLDRVLHGPRRRSVVYRE